ncbi:hypothetical protein ACQUFY_08310 [Robbsia andropogonis]|uniref:hypothetical protein n=1 Tax=Robbsia andropogonis TaxID=28092 RepID=UPI003D237BAF
MKRKRDFKPARLSHVPSAREYERQFARDVHAEYEAEGRPRRVSFFPMPRFGLPFRAAERHHRAASAKRGRDAREKYLRRLSENLGVGRAA